MKIFKILFVFILINARNQIRTGDTKIFSLLLYQLSYPGYPTIRISTFLILYKENIAKFKILKNLQKEILYLKYIYGFIKC